MRIKVVIGIVGVIVLAAAILYQYGKSIEAQYADAVIAYVASQRVVLQELSVLTDRNDVIAAFDTVMNDCRARSEFDELLGQLHLLSGANLERVSSQFDACGGYFASKKAFMVFAMEKEYAALETYVALLPADKNTDAYAALLGAWQQIIAAEKQKSTLLREQVTVQKEIIDELRKGNLPDSDVIGGKLVRAQQISQQLNVADRQVDTARDTETNIELE